MGRNGLRIEKLGSQDWEEVKVGTGVEASMYEALPSWGVSRPKGRGGQDQKLEE